MYIAKPAAWFEDETVRGRDRIQNYGVRGNGVVKPAQVRERPIAIAGTV